MKCEEKAIVSINWEGYESLEALVPSTENAGTTIKLRITLKIRGQMPLAP